MVTVLPLAGSNAYPCDATRSVNVEPVALPCTDSVSVRAAHPDVGSLSTTRSTLTDEPRSTCSHCGNALFVLSQYVEALPSAAFDAAYACETPLADIVLPSARFDDVA